MASKNVHEVNDLNFEAEVIQSQVPVLVDFSAVWCQPCKALAPIVDQVADENVGTYKVTKVDIDESPATARRFGDYLASEKVQALLRVFGKDRYGEAMYNDATATARVVAD